MDTVETILVGGGVAAILAAAAGGGLKAFGVEIAGLASIQRQLILALAGTGLIAIGLLLPEAGKGGKEGAEPRVKRVLETFTMSLDDPAVVKEGLVFCFWNVTPYHAAGGAPPDMPTAHQEAYRDLKAKLGVFREGEAGRSCDQMGDHYRPPVRLGESFSVSHPTCSLNVLVRRIKRTIKAPHTWDDFLREGPTGRDRSDWLEGSVELRLTGACPSE